MTKFVVVIGGVISAVGKGVTTSALGKVLKEHGYKVTLIKIDPYLNYDAGTLRPTEHGEVWVTDDGGEIDQDLGTYERFLDQDLPKQNNITTGQIFKDVIDRERRGEYLGKTVEFIPHIPDEIIRRVKQAADGYEIAIIEIGGIVGDYENKPFLFAMKSLERKLGADSVAYLLIALLPMPSHIEELKTRPVLQAIKLLHQEGISPDLILCRAKYPIDDVRKIKIEQCANIPMDHILSAPDVDTIYQIPLDLEDEQVGQKVLKKLGLKSKRTPDWSTWQKLVTTMRSPSRRVKVAIVGKYFDTGNFSLTDSYFSVYQALLHAGAALDIGVDIQWIDAKKFEISTTTPGTCGVEELAQYDGVIIPGGFGAAGVEGKIKAIEYVRKHNIPYLGLCYGLQLAAVEYARNVCSLFGAHTTEVDPHTPYPIIDLLPMQREALELGKYGASMRLGSYPAMMKPGSLMEQLYKDVDKLKDGIGYERHRHRYEVNPTFVPLLEQAGLLFSGYYERADGTRLMECLELPNHPFFVAGQAHAEFTSRLGRPSPFFYGFVRAAGRARQQEEQPAVVRERFQGALYEQTTL